MGRPTFLGGDGLCRADCNVSSYIITMARQPQAGHGGRGGGRGWRGGRFPTQNEPGSLPCKSGDVGACKDLEGNVFTIGSGNKGKDLSA
jgi:hypothetical protein